MEAKSDQIRLADGTAMDIIRIVGGPQRIEGATRDTLRIEFAKPDDNIVSYMKTLKDTFSDPEKTKTLSFISGEDGTEYTIGIGYSKFVTCATETKETISPLGKPYPSSLHTVILVVLAQLTYKEATALWGETINVC